MLVHENVTGISDRAPKSNLTQSLDEKAKKEQEQHFLAGELFLGR